jgi:hypothetical protein
LEGVARYIDNLKLFFFKKKNPQNKMCQSKKNRGKTLGRIDNRIVPTRKAGKPDRKTFSLTLNFAQIGGVINIGSGWLSLKNSTTPP